MGLALQEERELQGLCDRGHPSVDLRRGATVRDVTAREVEEVAEIRETLQRQAARRMKLPADNLLTERLVVDHIQRSKRIYLEVRQSIGDA